MSIINKMALAIRARKHVEWLLVLSLFFLMSALYMGKSFTNFGSTVLGKAGDHTAGIMYVNFTHSGRPWPGFTQLTNYPYGENLRIPISATTQGQLLTHWFFAKATNLVAGWNLMVLIGYMSNALIMYCFIRWLLKNRWIAFFGAIAVTFNPYHAFAATGQIAGMFSGIFTLALWRFIVLWRKPTRNNALLLGLLLGISFYIDGYFILLGLILLGALWLAVLSYSILIARTPLKKVKVQIQYLALSSTLVVLSLLPLIWINIHFAQQIGEILGNARTNILLEAQTYSARASYYLSPRSVLYLGLSVVCLAIFYVTYLRSTFLKSTRASLVKNESSLFLGWILFVVCVIAAWTSLQPIFNIGQREFYNPSYLIVSLVSVWRVFGRLYILVDITIVTLACLGLEQLLKKYPSKKSLLLVIAISLVAIEIGVPSLKLRQPSFDYNKTPTIYTWLRDNGSKSNIQAIAEYPLEGYGYDADYFTFLQISHTPIINANLHNSPQLKLKQSIIGINDPQTLPVLRALGIDLVNLRDVSREKAGEELTIRHSVRSNKELELFMSHIQPNKNIDTYKILPGKITSYALAPEPKSLTQSKLKPNGTAEYSFNGDVVLSTETLPKAVRKSNVSVSFDIRNTITRKATIVQNGELLWAGTIGPNKQTIKLTARTDQPITIHVQVAKELSPSVLTNLQAL